MGTLEKAHNMKVYSGVKRIGYRCFVLENAQELGFREFVQNETDKSVIVFVQGEKSQVEQFLKKIKETPQPVAVKDFEVKVADLNPNLNFFSIEFGSLAEELQEGFGSMEKEFKDYREEFRDYRQEF
jgi:acylphosphatase